MRNNIDNNQPRDDGDRGPQPGFHPILPLNTSRDKIIQECENTDFKEAGMRNPYPVKESAKTIKRDFYISIRVMATTLMNASI